MDGKESSAKTEVRRGELKVNELRTPQSSEGHNQLDEHNLNRDALSDRQRDLTDRNKDLRPRHDRGANKIHAFSSRDHRYENSGHRFVSDGADHRPELNNASAGSE